jgi:hypothetical protein
MPSRLWQRPIQRRSQPLTCRSCEAKMSRSGELSRALGRAAVSGQPILNAIRRLNLECNPLAPCSIVFGTLEFSELLAGTLAQPSGCFAGLPSREIQKLVRPRLAAALRGVGTLQIRRKSSTVRHTAGCGSRMLRWVKTGNALN